MTRNAAIRTLRLFFEDLDRLAVARRRRRPDCSATRTWPPKPSYLPRPLPPDLDQAVQKAFIEAGTFAAMALLLLRYTGMRIGEMRALPLNAMEASGPDTFSLRVPVGKTYSERLIPLDERTVELIERIIAQRACLLEAAPSAHARRRLMMIDHWGRHLTAAKLRRSSSKNSPRTSTPPSTSPATACATTFATEMARAGMPVPALMKLLGHKTPKMTMRYVEVAQNDVRQAYDQALTQLSVIRSVQSRTLPALPVPAAALPQQPGSDQLLKLMEAMITCLESHRRDELDPRRAQAAPPLHQTHAKGRLRLEGYPLKAAPA